MSRRSLPPRGAPPPGGAGLRPLLLVATFNPGKARELARLLEPIRVATVGLAERGLREPYEEEGATYEENARGKARHYAALSGLVAVADDSGLEVDALGGAPGPLSARYGGPGLDDAGRCRRLLREIAAVPEPDRGARYVAVAAIATPAGPTRTFRGVCEGRIALEGRGTGGFGYDPLFYYPPLGATFGEISEERKHAVSHRGQALGLLVSFLVSEEGRKFLPTGGS